MEYVNGPTLRALLDAGPLSPRAAFRITKQTLSALAYAHAHQVVHRDIKPANIVIQPVSKTSFHVKVLDFGFAKFLTPRARDGAELSDPGMTFGTPKYMSPEQLLNSSTAGPPADLYALGVVLFEMLAGRPTFVGEIRELVRQHLADAPPRISELVTGLADPVATDQLLAKSSLALLAYRLQDIWTPDPPTSVARRETPVELEPAPAHTTNQPTDRSSNGETIDLLSAAAAQLDRGGTLSTDTVEALLAEVRSHPRDPRPHLLLARLNVARDRPPQTVFRYALAFRADPNVRDDPHIRPDLQALRQNARVGAQATRLLARLDETPGPTDTLQADASPSD